MPRYRNLSGSSGVVSYETAPDSITLEFVDGRRYRYTHASAGRANVERMKRLATTGRGLSAFVSRVVRDAWDRRTP